MQEIEYLTKKELPAVLSLVQLQLKSCFTNAVDKSEKPLKLVCTASSAGIDNIHGSTTLQFDTVCSLEIFIKTSKSQPLIKASFRSDRQWKLQQIQDAYNSLREANRILKVLQEDNCHLSTIVYYVEDIIKELQKCQDKINIPKLLSLNTLINSPLAKMFVPPLPGDTLINMCIVEDKMVLIIYTVQQAHTSASLQNKHHNIVNKEKNQKMLFYPVGSIIEYGGIRYEVSTSRKCELQIDNLTKCLQVTRTTQMLLHSFLDKVRRFL